MLFENLDLTIEVIFNVILDTQKQDTLKLSSPEALCIFVNPMEALPVPYYKYYITCYILQLQLGHLADAFVQNVLHRLIHPLTH